MEKIDTFNIRVYGLLAHNQSLLIIKEPYAGEILYKLPGGGLEFGESLIDGLKRELKEELDLDLCAARHFYTQEDFMVSRFRANEQLLLIYFLIEVDNIQDLKKRDPSIDEIMWIPLNELKTQHVNLPTDQLVIERFLKERKDNSL